MFDPSLIPLVQRLERDPDDQDALDTLWRGLTDRGEHQTLAVLAEKIARRARSPERSVELLHRAAELWARDLHRDDLAVPLWQRVLEADPGHALAMAGLAAAFVRAGRHEQAAALHQRILERVTDPRARLTVLEAVARARAAAGDAAGELAALREIVELEVPVAVTVESRRSLARLLVQRGRGAQGQGDDAHPDVREAARLLGSIARAGGTGRSQDFAAAALALWPGEESAFQIMQGNLSMRHAEVTTLRIRFLAANPGSRMASQVRADLADGYLAAGRVDDAIAVLAAAVGEDAEASQRLARLYERTGRHRDLALLLATSALPTERAPRLALLRRRASAWRVANDRKAALAALRDVLAEAPSDPEALGEIERDCRLRGDVSELRARLTAAAADATAPVAQRSRWLRETAQLTEHAGEVDAAVALWLRAAEAAESADAAGEAQEAREAVVRLLAHEERWDELLAHLARQAQGAGRAELRRAWWLRWVEVHRERRDDPSREAAVLAGLVADDPTDDRAALLLIDAHRRAGQAAAAAAAYRELIARSPPEHRAARWGQLAGHLEQHGDLTGALEAWHHARTADPSQALAWAAEERILEATGESEALLEVLTAHANHPVAAGRRAGELFQRAAWLARDLARADEAARLAERAIKFDLDDPGLVALAEHLGVHALEDVPTSLLEAALEGESVVHDTGEYPAAHLEDLDAPGAVTGEHTPAEGTHFEELISAHEFDESVEDTITRARRSELPVTPEADPGDLLGLEEASTRELPAFAETLSGRPAAATSTDDATSAGDAVAAMDEPADGSPDDFVEVAAVTGEHPVASRTDDGPRTAETALPDVAERAPDAALSSTTDRPAAAEAERTRDGAPPEWAGRDPSSPTDPLEDEVIPIDDEASALAEPEPAPLPRASLPPEAPPRASLPPLAPSVPPPPADDLPSIIVDDALLDVAVVSAPPPEAPPIAPALPPLTARIAPPAPPVLPPLAASAFVASAASAPPRASWTPPLAPPPPPLAPLPPSAFAPAAPVALPPLAPPPGSPWSPPAALPPLSAQGFASSSAPGLAAPSPPSPAPAPGYDGGDPFAASGDPFAAMPAPPAAFSAAPAVAFSAGPPLVGGDPFAGLTAPAASPVASMKPSAPLPPPVAPVAPPPSNFQKTMAALFEQALVAQRGPG